MAWFSEFSSVQFTVQFGFFMNHEQD